MKRVRCPKCNNYVTFDETKYKPGDSLIFQCQYCGKQFGIRLGGTKKKKEESFGEIVVIENAYHYKQVLTLKMGDNIIGRFRPHHDIQCPIETDDLNIDYVHCIINVSIDKKGKLKYILRDGPSFHGTYAFNKRLDSKDRLVIEDNALITLGETSIILHTKDHSEE